MFIARKKLVLATAGLMLPCAAVHAQPQAPTYALEEIVVTAQRREQSMQDVPVAVSAVTANMAADLGIGDPQSMAQLVPGLTYNRQASGTMPFLRGIGTSSSFIGNEPSVAVFVDDVYVNNGNAAVFEFNNIDMVEVLKGPQGTLFGRNATGGVVHVRTRNPEFETTGDVSVGYGKYDTFTTQLYGSTGLTDTIAANLAVYMVDQGDGWGKNVVNGDDVNTNESWGVRGKVLFEPDANTSLLLSATFNKRESDQGMAQRVVDGYYGFGGYRPDLLGAGFHDGATNHRQYYDTEFYQFSGKLTKDMENATFVSITSFGDTDTFFEIDMDASPTDILNGDVIQAGKTFTQEFQLLSPESSDVEWILGFFYLWDESRFYADFDGLGLAARGFGQSINAEQETNSYSAFAQIATEILPNTNLTIGMRYTYDKREQTDGYGVTADGQFSGPYGSDETFTAPTGRVSLDYRFTDEIMGYVAYNRGFKSGVYNLPGYDPATTGALPPVEPEDLDAYTVGVKTEFFEGRLRLNAEAYYYDYTNIQIQNNLPNGAGTILVNGGEATIQGIDLEMAFIPMENLTVNLNLAFADGEYDVFDNGPTFFPQGQNAPIGIPGGCSFSDYPVGGTPMVQRACSLAGNETANTVPFSSNLALVYTIPLDVGLFDLGLSWAHGGDYYMEPHNTDFVKQKTTDIINTSIKWTSLDDKFNVRLWAKNITDEEYWSYLAYSATSGPKGAQAEPRTYGVTLGMSF